jgi:hypothetical protein
MMLHSRIAAALLLLWFGSGAAARAPATLTLTCGGTVSYGPDASAPITVNILLNFTDGTVQQEIVAYPVKITAVDDLAIKFSGSRNIGSAENNITGNIDRVTGRAAILTDVKTSKTRIAGTYILQCRPAKRIF